MLGINSMSRNRLSVALLLSMVCGAAFAEKVNGPAIYFDQSQALNDSPEESRWIKSMQRNHFQVYALFPLTARSLRTLLVPTLQYSESYRTVDFYDGQRSVGSWSVITPGLIAVPDFRPADLRFFLVASRYGSPDFVTLPRHMGEYIVGMDFDGVLAGIKPDFLTVLKSRLIYRLRDYPNRKTYLTVFYLDAELNDGIYLSAGFPSHFRIGWKDSVESKNFFAEVLGESRTMPISLTGENLWVDGHVLDYALGYKFLATEPMYLEFRAGMKSEGLGFYNADGMRVGSFESKLAPFGSVALKTMFYN
jgi:hypothetical protein